MELVGSAQMDEKWWWRRVVEKEEGQAVVIDLVEVRFAGAPIRDCG